MGPDSTLYACHGLAMRLADLSGGLLATGYGHYDKDDHGHGSSPHGIPGRGDFGGSLNRGRLNDLSAASNAFFDIDPFSGRGARREHGFHSPGGRPDRDDFAKDAQGHGSDAGGGSDDKTRGFMDFLGGMTSPPRRPATPVPTGDDKVRGFMDFLGGLSGRPKRDDSSRYRGPGYPAEYDQPSSRVNPAKAKEILRDGTVHGHPLTDAQRGMFGAAAGRSDNCARPYHAVHAPLAYSKTAECGRCGFEFELPDEAIDTTCPRCGATYGAVDYAWLEDPLGYGYDPYAKDDRGHGSDSIPGAPDRHGHPPWDKFGTANWHEGWDRGDTRDTKGRPSDMRTSPTGRGDYAVDDTSDDLLAGCEILKSQLAAMNPGGSHAEYRHYAGDWGPLAGAEAQPSNFDGGGTDAWGGAVGGTMHPAHWRV